MEGKPNWATWIEEGYFFAVKTQEVDVEEVWKTNRNDWTPLGYAIEKENVEIFKVLLLEKGADVEKEFFEYKGGKNWTPLGYAIEKGNVAIVKALLDNGADVEKEFHYKEWTPLGHAIDKGNLEIVKALLDKGADVSKEFIKEKGWTPLGYAVEKGNVEIVMALLDKEADVEKEFHKGKWTPLGYAIEKENRDMIKVLLDKGANVSKEFGKEGGGYYYGYWSPIGYAIEKVNVEIVQLLLQNGADMTKEFEKIVKFGVYAGDFLILNFLVQRSSLEKCAEYLVRCKSLNCSNQGLQSLPLWMAYLPWDVKLILKGNPLASVPQSVKEGGSKSVMQYLKEILASGKASWKKCKIMVLGKEGVGKTHIYHRIRGTKYDLDISTDGIEIKDFVLDGMELSWFDFGGQEVFYPTHQFFLTTQCIYLVVFSMTDQDYIERVRYWLQNVRNYSKDVKNAAKVLVVATHSDMVKKKEEREKIWDGLKDLLQQSGNVFATAEVSCKTGHGFDELKRGIKLAIEDAKLDLMEIPIYYLNLLNEMTENKRRAPRISWKDFVKRFDLNEIQIESGCRFLSNMGLCFYNVDLDVVVLELQWLANMFKALITFRNKWVKDGEVLRRDLVHVWKEDQIDENMKLLEAFDMAIPKIEEGKWIIPCMLNDKRKGKALDFTESIYCFERIFKFEMLPQGLIGRLIIRTQNQAIIKMKECWRTGVSFEVKDEGEGEIEMLHNEIHLRLITFKRSHFIRQLVQDCCALLSSTRLSYEQYIVCPHCFKRELKYEDAVSIIISNEKRFICGGEKVDVRLLGSDVTLRFVKVFDATEIKVGEFLGKGAFGEVFKAKWKGRDVAVKQLISQKLQQEQGFDEFQNEVGTMSKLEHRNLVHLFGVMLNPLRMVMEFCSGGTLCKAIENGSTKGKEESIALDIANGMLFLHSRKPPIVHRDLKSENIFLTDEMVAKVADFGCSAIVAERLANRVGTEMTMAPEVQLGQGYTEMCDVYSYAVVLFELYRGPSKERDVFQELYGKENKKQIQNKILHENLRPKVPSNAPVWMKDLIGQMWQHNPKSRPTFNEIVYLIKSKGVLRLPRKAEKEKMRSRFVCEDFEGSIICMEETKGSVWCGKSNGVVSCFSVRDFKEVHSKTSPNDKEIISICPFEENVLCGSGSGRTLLFFQEQKVSTLRKFSGLFRRDSKGQVVVEEEEERSEKLIKMIRIGESFFCGHYSGLITVVSKSNNVIDKKKLDSRISCMVKVDQYVIIGGKSILKMFDFEEPTMLIENAHEGQYCNALVYLGSDKLLSCTVNGDFCIWNIRQKSLICKWKISQKFYIVSFVDDKLWIGIDNEILIYNDNGSFLTTLTLIKEGEVVCIENVSFNHVWISLRHKQDKGSLMQIEFCDAQ